jgi:hypothetical protein
MRELDVYEDFAKHDDPAEALGKYIAKILHIARAFALPVGAQADMFTGPASAMSAVEQAYQSGRTRGIMGQNPDEQAYPSNSDLGQEHMRGWHDGQKVLQEQFLALNEAERQAEAEKKAKADAAAQKKAEKEAKQAAKVPKTDTGETVQ